MSRATQWSILKSSSQVDEANRQISMARLITAVMVMVIVSYSVQNAESPGLTVDDYITDTEQPLTINYSIMHRLADAKLSWLLEPT